MKTLHRRRLEIDLLRGLAILGMIIFHIFFILNFFEIQAHDMNSPKWTMLARAVQITFLTLVGVSITLSTKPITNQIKRGIIVLSAGFIITLTTFLVIPDYYIKFGILHLIGTSIILLSPLAHKRALPLILAIIALITSIHIPNLSTHFKPFYIMGIPTYGVSAALDYFPILPWISVPLIGITIGNFLYKNPILKILPSLKPYQFIKPIILMGQHSLIIYITHVPLILLILFIITSIK